MHRSTLRAIALMSIALILPACTVDSPAGPSAPDPVVVRAALTGACNTSLGRGHNGFTARFDVLGCGDELQVLDHTNTLGPAVAQAVSRWRATGVGAYGIAVPTTGPGDHLIDVIWGNTYGNGVFSWYCGTVERNGIGNDTLRVHRSTAVDNCVDPTWAATQNPADLITHELGHALGWFGENNYSGLGGASAHCVNVLFGPYGAFNSTPCMHEVATMFFVWGIIDGTPPDFHHILTGLAFNSANPLAMLPGARVTLDPSHYRYVFDRGSPDLGQLTAEPGDQLNWSMSAGSGLVTLSPASGPTTELHAISNGTATLRLGLTAVAADSIWVLPNGPIATLRTVQVGAVVATGMPYGEDGTHCQD